MVKTSIDYFDDAISYRKSEIFKYEEISSIAYILDTNIRQVKIWFQNARQLHNYAKDYY